MNHGSLFSGIGGFDLASEWMGWNNVFHCEWNEFGQKILKHYWPDAVSYGDITKTDFTIWRGRVDIITGGVPCQPASTAGKRKGKDDDRWLWDEGIRVLRECQPRIAVFENVAGLISLVQYESSPPMDGEGNALGEIGDTYNRKGRYLAKEILEGIEAEGYKVEQTFLLPAAGVNAPHKRDRCWFVAYSNKERLQYRNKINARQIQNIEKRIQNNREANGSCSEWDAANAQDNRQDGRETDTSVISGNSTESEQGRNYDLWGEPIRFSEQPFTTHSERIGQPRPGRTERRMRKEAFGNWETSWSYPDDRWPTQSPLRGGDDGISKKLALQCLESLGNAIVPQVAFEIFKVIEQMNKV